MVSFFPMGVYGCENWKLRNSKRKKINISNYRFRNNYGLHKKTINWSGLKQRMIGPLNQLSATKKTNVLSGDEGLEKNNYASQCLGIKGEGHQ